MQKLKCIPKYVAVGVLITAVADVLLMLLGAVLVERGILAYDCVGVWSLASLVVASIVCGLFCGSKTGLSSNAYAASVFSFVLLVILPMTASELTGIGALVKGLIAMICGAFIGNFFGIRRHNRLRKNGRKKRLRTK